jgi:hypothetical protein
MLFWISVISLRVTQISENFASAEDGWQRFPIRSGRDGGCISLIGKDHRVFSVVLDRRCGLWMQDGFLRKTRKKMHLVKSMS